MTLHLNGYPILSGYLSRPRNGAWTAELQVAGEAPLSGRATLTDGIAGYSGAIVSGSAYAGRGHWRIVGGAGGLGGVIDAKHYRSATVGKVLGDICSDTGEAKSPLILPNIALRNLSFWTRPLGTGGSAVASLADALGVVWRILPTGQIWLGDSGFTIPAPTEYPVLDRDPWHKSYTIAADSLILTTGMTQEAGQIQRIEYSIGDNLRARYWVD